MPGAFSPFRPRHAKEARLSAEPRETAAPTGMWLLVFLALLVVTFACLSSFGNVDMNIWLGWMKTIRARGTVAAFGMNYPDYPPVSFLILAGAGKAAALLHVGPHVALKGSLALFLCATTGIFLAWTRDPRLAAALHVALILDSVVQGYLNVCFAPPLLLALWALQAGRTAAFSVLFTVACLTKWQPAILAPFVVLHLLGVRAAGDWRRVPWRKVLAGAALPALGTAGLFAVWFTPSAVGRSLLLATRHTMLSGNALNANWVLTHLLHVLFPRGVGPLFHGLAFFIDAKDLPPALFLAPRLVFWSVYAVALLRYARAEKSFENLLLYALVGYLAYFLFNTGVHETHYFLAVPLSLLLFWLNRDHLALAVFFPLAVNLNLFLMDGFDGSGFPFDRAALGVDLALVAALINVGFFVVLWRRTFRTGTAAAAAAGPGA